MSDNGGTYGDILLVGGGLLGLELLDLVVLLVVQGVVDAGDRHSVVDSGLVDHGC